MSILTSLRLALSPLPRAGGLPARDIPDLTACRWETTSASTVRRRHPRVLGIPVATIDCPDGELVVYTDDDDLNPVSIVVRVDAQPHQLVHIAEVVGWAPHAVALAAATLAHDEYAARAR